MDASRALSTLTALGVDPGPLPKLLKDIEALNGKLVKAAQKSSSTGGGNLEFLSLSAQKQQLVEEADRVARDLLVQARQTDTKLPALKEKLAGIDTEILENLEQVRALMSERDQLTQQFGERGQLFSNVETWYNLQDSRTYLNGLPWQNRPAHWPGAREALRAYLVRYADLAAAGAPDADDLLSWFCRRR